MKYYNETIRLAKLIGLGYRTVGHGVWRRDKPIPYVPWAPFECEADWEPIRLWVQEHHPCWDGWDWSSPAAYCRAVLKAFGEPETGTCIIHHIDDHITGERIEYSTEPVDPNALTHHEAEVVIAELAERLKRLTARVITLQGHLGWLRWSEAGLNAVKAKIDAYSAALDDMTPEQANIALAELAERLASADKTKTIALEAYEREGRYRINQLRVTRQEHANEIANVLDGLTLREAAVVIAELAERLEDETEQREMHEASIREYYAPGLAAARGELRALFAIQHIRVEAATKAWQEAHGKTDTLPDLGELVGWLMQEREAAVANRDKLRDALGAAIKMFRRYEMDVDDYRTPEHQAFMEQLAANAAEMPSAEKYVLMGHIVAWQCSQAANAAERSE